MDSPGAQHIETITLLHRKLEISIFVDPESSRLSVLFPSDDCLHII